MSWGSESGLTTWCPSKVIGISDLPVHGSDLVELPDGLSGKLLVVLREYLENAHTARSLGTINHHQTVQTSTPLLETTLNPSPANKKRAAQNRKNPGAQSPKPLTQRAGSRRRKKRRSWGPRIPKYMTSARGLGLGLQLKKVQGSGSRVSGSVPKGLDSKTSRHTANFLMHSETCMPRTALSCTAGLLPT